MVLVVVEVGAAGHAFAVPHATAGPAGSKKRRAVSSVVEPTALGHYR